MITEEARARADKCLRVRVYGSNLSTPWTRGQALFLIKSENDITNQADGTLLIDVYNASTDNTSFTVIAKGEWTHYNVAPKTPKEVHP